MKPGTVDALIHRYKNAHAFLKLRKSTQKMYSENLEIISRWAGDVGVRDLDIEMALDFYDQMYPQTPTKANHAMVVLWLLYSRSEEHTSELQSLMRISYAVFCL